MEADAPQGATPRVLVVEDEADLRNLLKLMLTRQGFNVATASDGGDALSQLAEVHPDIIVTDLMMPNVNGFVLCDELRKRDAYRELPILVLTAIADSQEALELATVPGIRVMQKPARMKELGPLLREMIDELRQPGGGRTSNPDDPDGHRADPVTG